MKHYPHHIGDFDKATRHLSRLERSVYRDLIDMYYDTEDQLPLDVPMICRKIIARSDEEVTAVQQTLNEFFTKTERGWWQERCEEVLEAYRANTSQKSQAGKASAAKKASKRQQALNARSTDVGTGVEQTNNGTSTNQKPITINQEPIKTSEQSPDLPPPPENDDDEPAKKTGRLLSTEEDRQCAQWLYDELIVKINPGAKPPNIPSWANDIRLMREIDERSHRQICDLFRWAASDPFWCANILSPSTLRKKWDQLVMQRGRVRPASQLAQGGYAGTMANAERAKAMIFGEENATE